MRFELLDNGMDSLNSGLNFYGKFLDHDDSYEFEQETYLKLATICIQNTIEIFSMKILSDVDEMLIYPERFRPKLEKIKRNIKFEKNLMIHNVLVNYDNDILTISYSKCIRLLKQLFNISDIQKLNLTKLGKIRNQLTHLGLARDINYHHILLTINSALDFIVEFFYPKLKDERFEEMDLVYEKAQDLFETGELFAHDIWAAFWGFRFERINSSLTQAVHELEENEEIKNGGITVNLLIEKNTEASGFQVEFFDSDTGELVNDVSTLNLPRLDATVLSGESVDGPIYAIIDHKKDEKGLYVYSEPLKLDGYEDYYERFWGYNNSRCYRAHICKKSFKDLIKIIMNQCYEVPINQLIDE